MSLPFEPDVFTPDSAADTVRVDSLCCDLLQQFRQYLTDEKNLTPRLAGSRAGSADYFLRDYLVDHCRINPFLSTAEHITAFAGNWYIIHRLEPNLAELKTLLQGINSFYNFCAELSLIDRGQLPTIDAACNACDFYQQRIDSFYALEGNGFDAWKQTCPDP